MEYFDVIDREGNATGAVLPKGSALADGQYYVGAHAYICNAQGEYLLQRRALDKAFLPGMWEIHMGHVVAGETGLETIIREVREEVGLGCAPEDAHYVGRVVWEDGHHIIDVYRIAAEFDVDQLTLQPEEVIGAKAVSKDEMLALIARMDYRPAAYREMVAAAVQDRWEA